MARLSLTLIAAFFFLKSFASGQEADEYGFAWFNSNAVATACNPADIEFIDSAVEEMFFERLSYPLDDWISLDNRRNLRGRELCTGACIDKCTNCHYMCNGMCGGCGGGRSLQTSDRELLYTKAQLEGFCEEKVQSMTTPDVTADCAAAVQYASCVVALLL
jgi:hypothetical protein